MTLDEAQGGGWLRLPESETADHVVKPVFYLPTYEQLLAPLRAHPFTLLELGVWTGQSLQMWRDAFPLATIVGVDLAPLDLQLGSRVHIIQGDQTDVVLMRRLREDYAPNGFDVIIDDASHYGVTTARSLQALYSEHLRPGGMYCIEDWGTGYLPTWPDGGKLESSIGIEHLDNSKVPMRPEVEAPIPMPSHDIGMVGLVKRLIDHTSGDTVRSAQPAAVGDLLAIDSMIVTRNIVTLYKPQD
ncbi:MAG: class I SAM-dependent methyltransferase [Solirubrobacteraceae bacterium]